MVSVLYIDLLPPPDIHLGITPFVDPEDLKFYFQEIHRLAGK